MHRLRIIGLVVVGLVLSGCSFFPTQVVVTQIVTQQPTNTLAPLFSMTPKYTATLPPTGTDIPSITPVPTVTPPLPAATRTPTVSPTPPIYGVIPPSNPTVNLRSGASSSFPIITGVKSGTRVIVLGTNEEKDWFNVRLDDGREGWLLASLVTVSNPDVLPTLSTQEFVQRTSVAGTLVALGTEDNSGGPTPTPRRPGIKNSNDVLAYCRSTTNGEPKKTIPEGTPVFVYWSWFAKTPEQLQDHVNYATYTVTVDGKPLNNWKSYKTEVVRFPDGYYWVYWYVPIGTPAVGDHSIDYKLTWSQQITDGIKKYGPGGDEASNSGSCVFTIK